MHVAVDSYTRKVCLLESWTVDRKALLLGPWAVDRYIVTILTYRILSFALLGDGIPGGSWEGLGRVLGSWEGPGRGPGGSWGVAFLGRICWNPAESKNGF